MCIPYLVFIRGNYGPLHETIDILGSSYHPGINKKEIAVHDEFIWLQETARIYVDEMDQNQNRLQAYIRRLRSQLLLRLLESPFTFVGIHRKYRRWGWISTTPIFLVIHFYFDDSHALLLSDDIEKGRGALGFAIINVFSELMGDEYLVEALNMAERVSVVMNSTADTSLMKG